MKYLRKIFEDFSNSELKELRETCEQYLAYLLDEEFTIRLDIDNEPLVDIDICPPKTGRYSKEDWFNSTDPISDSGLSWSDVKDQVIPLISLFKRGHFGCNLECVEFYFWENTDNIESDFYGSKIDYLIDDNSEYLDSLENNGISCISIRVKKY
jgi:hypothetical protein